MTNQTTQIAHRIAADIQASGTLPVTSPFSGETLANIEQVDEQAVDTALSIAQGLFDNQSEWLDKSRRMDILYRTADLLDQRSEQFAVQAASEGGKPLMDSRAEIARAVDGLRNCAELLRSESGREIPMGVTPASAGRTAFTHHEPIGVVVAVSAFNHPLNLIVHQVGPAVASGCPVIIKPAEDTPLSCFALIDLLREAGLPDGWAQALLTDSIATAEKLVTDERVAFFSFIGSAKVGWHLRSQLAAGTRCALEHGGAAPVIVNKDVDLDDVIPPLSKGGFYHAGQVCVSVQRVYAHRDIVEELARRLSASAQSLHVGDPTDAKTEIGPLIRPREVERIHEWVSEAIEAGAECLCGGQILDDNCYAPTVLLNPPKQVRVSQQEIFGPVICIYSYEEVNAAIQSANALPFAFQAAVFTKDMGFALQNAKRLAASAVMINDHTAFRVDWMPFAGLRQSGLGVGGIPYTFEDMQIEKLIVMKHD